MPILWEIDPTSEDATNTPLSLVGTVNSVDFRLTEMDLTPPDLDPIFAVSADTEGDPFIGARHRNRVISLSFLARATTDALLQTAIYQIQQKVDKLRREGGTLKFTTQAGTTVVGDVLFVQFKPELVKEMYGLTKMMRFVLDFTCKPYFRGTAVQQSDHVETTLPCIVWTETSLAGDVPGLGKLIVDNDDATNSQSWVVWGLQSRYYDASANAALFYEAEGRTAMGGSAIAAGPSGASGAGSNVMRNTALTNAYVAVLSTQATGGGAHLSHVGRFRVWARVQTPTTNTGAVSLALEWAQGDYHATTINAATTFPVDDWDGSWRLVDLGQVSLEQVSQGTQRWEGRVLAKSTVIGDDIDIDYLFLVPVDEGGGEAASVLQAESFTAITARDEFDQTAGALTGKTLPVGGTWAGAGDADDANVDATNHWVTRTATGDADLNTGRYLIAGTTTFTDAIVQVNFKRNVANSAARCGVLARYIDTSNWLEVAVANNVGFHTLLVLKRVTGTVTTLATVNLPTIVLDTFYTLRATVNADGRWAVWLILAGASFGDAIVHGQDSALATAGALATGKSGFYDAQVSATACTRTYDNFLAGVAATADAAIYPSQSLEIRHDRVIREDSGGTLWQRPSSYEGDYLRVPAAGKEGRTARFIVKASRDSPGTGADSGVDDISARLTYTPRYLVLPS